MSDDRPRIRVAAVIPLQGGIVLVRHTKDGRTYNLLPGGGVERSETLGDALVREVREETGLVVRPVRPLLLSDTIAPDASRHVVNVTLLAEVLGGRLTQHSADPRVAGVGIASLEEVESVDLRPPIGRELADMAASGFHGEARYLGRLWVEEGGTA